MLTLQDSDFDVLTEIASKRTNTEAEKTKLLDLLKDGFSRFASEEDVLEGREAFFRDKAEQLILNSAQVGKNSDIVFIESQDHIANIFRRLGVPVSDVEDMVQKALTKLWRARAAEKYNPLKASWNHYLYTILERMKNSYFERKKRDPLAQAFYFQQFKSPHDEEFRPEPSEIEGVLHTAEKMVLDETLMDFQVFLKKEKPTRDQPKQTTLMRCKVSPPSAEDWKSTKTRVTEVVEATLIREGKQCSRIELDNGDRFLWDNRGISEIRLVKVTKQETTEKSFTLLYDLMMKGFQIEEIANKLKVGTSTAHNWVREMERLFCKWWKESDRIPATTKYMADPIITCPRCGEEHFEQPEATVQIGRPIKYRGTIHYAKSRKGIEGEPVSANWCTKCGSISLEAVESKVTVPFPWTKVRGTQDLKVKTDKARKKPMVVATCSIFD
jgi:hypothetical protein